MHVSSFSSRPSFCVIHKFWDIIELFSAYGTYKLSNYPPQKNKCQSKEFFTSLQVDTNNLELAIDGATIISSDIIFIA